MIITQPLTFDTAQELIRAYDQKHWRHKPGGPTVRHTYTHLRLSLKKLFVRLAQKNGLRTGWDAVRGHVAAGVLLEAAFRLANDTGSSLFGLLTSPPGPATIAEWMEEVRQSERYERVQDWHFELTVGLLPFEQTIERSEHDEPIAIDIVHTAAIHLARFALLVAECRGEEEFLRDLETRIGVNSFFTENTHG